MPITPEEQRRRGRFGEALERALKAKGATQTRMAEALDINQTTVSTWVRGVKRPRYREDVERIEKWLGPDVCPVGTLTAILYDTSRSGGAADPGVAAFAGADRLTPSQRAAVQAIVDEMLGPERR